MPKARLVKALEKEGFFLEFPRYQSREELITDVLREDNPRVIHSLPLLLQQLFHYQKIVSQITRKEKQLFDKVILIAARVYRKEKIQNELGVTIKKNRIRAKFSKREFEAFYESFREAQPRKREEEQRGIEKESRLRLQLDLQKSLHVLFSPAKIRIMDAIFNHRTLTNTELKYYYKAISPLNRAILNSSLQDYVRVIERTKKERV